MGKQSTIQRHPSYFQVSVFCLAASEGRGLKTPWYLFCPSNVSVCFVGRSISDPMGK